MDVVEMTRDLIGFKTPSRMSNVEITDYLENQLRGLGFEVERVEYLDAWGVPKASVVARKGPGTGGLALLSHSDTVPADGWDRSPFEAWVEDGRIYGRGSCDMKGPCAATIAAAARFDASELKSPVYVVVTADEEISGGGARSVVRDSVMLRDRGLRYGVVAEPTRMIPVYAHKGGCRMVITAHGRYAHSSTNDGINANFLIAPFLAEMAELHKLFMTDERYMNRDFNPPTNGWNMVIDDGSTAANVTAAKSVCTISFRPMPDHPSDEVIEMVRQKAEKHGLEFVARKSEPFVVPKDSPVVKAALAATGCPEPETVAFGTDGISYRELLECVVLGPGDIRQAHTINEFLALDQLNRAVEVYTQMIRHFCIAGA